MTSNCTLIRKLGERKAAEDMEAIMQAL